MLSGCTVTSRPLCIFTFFIRCLIHNIYDRYYIYKRYYLPDITDERLTTSTLSIARTSCLLFMNLKTRDCVAVFTFISKIV